MLQNAITTAVTAEANTRASADTAISGSVAALDTKFTTADTTLQTNINTETSQRTLAVQGALTAVSNLVASLTQSVTTAKLTTPLIETPVEQTILRINAIISAVNAEIEYSLRFVKPRLITTLKVADDTSNQVQIVAMMDEAEVPAATVDLTKAHGSIAWLKYVNTNPWSMCVNAVGNNRDLLEFTGNIEALVAKTAAREGLSAGVYRGTDSNGKHHFYIGILAEETTLLQLYISGINLAPVGDSNFIAPNGSVKLVISRTYNNSSAIQSDDYEDDDGNDVLRTDPDASTLILGNATHDLILRSLTRPEVEIGNDPALEQVAFLSDLASTVYFQRQVEVICDTLIEMNSLKVTVTDDEDETIVKWQDTPTEGFKNIPGIYTTAVKADNPMGIKFTEDMIGLVRNSGTSKILPDGHVNTDFPAELGALTSLPIDQINHLDTDFMKIGTADANINGSIVTDNHDYKAKIFDYITSQNLVSFIVVNITPGVDVGFSYTLPQYTVFNGTEWEGTNIVPVPGTKDDYVHDVTYEWAGYHFVQGSDHYLEGYVLWSPHHENTQTMNYTGVAWSNIDLAMDGYRTSIEQDYIDTVLREVGTTQSDYQENNPVTTIQLPGRDPQIVPNPSYIQNKPWTGVAILDGGSFVEPGIEQAWLVDGGDFTGMNGATKNVLEPPIVSPRNLFRNVIQRVWRGAYVEMPELQPNATEGTWQMYGSVLRWCSDTQSLYITDPSLPAGSKRMFKFQDVDVTIPYIIQLVEANILGDITIIVQEKVAIAVIEATPGIEKNATAAAIDAMHDVIAAKANKRTVALPNPLHVPAEVAYTVYITTSTPTFKQPVGSPKWASGIVASITNDYQLYIGHVCIDNIWYSGLIKVEAGITEVIVPPNYADNGKVVFTLTEAAAFIPTTDVWPPEVTPPVIYSFIQDLSEAYNEIQTQLGTKVDKNGTDRLMTVTEAAKLAGIESGAQVNPGDATTSTSGLMSAADKAKLDDIEDDAEPNPPPATETTDGLMAATDKARLDAITDTLYKNPLPATDTDNGLMAAEDKEKLDSIEEGAQVNPEIATEAEAKAGTNNTKIMTPLRVADVLGVAVGTLNTAITDEATARANMDEFLSDRIDAVSGLGGPLDPTDLGSETPTAETLTKYAMEDFWGSGGTFGPWDPDHPSSLEYTTPDTIVHYAVDLINGTWVINTYDGLNHKWQLTNTITTNPIVFHWTYVGDSTVPIATPTTAGIMKKYVDLDNSNTDGTVTQAVIRAALGTKVDKNGTDRLMTAAEAAKLADITDDAEPNPPPATETTDGLMAAEDKEKLDSIEEGAEVNPPPATETTDGLMAAEDKARLDAITDAAYKNPGLVTSTTDGIMPYTDHNRLAAITDADYKNPANATTTTDGLMAATDKGKLDSIEAGAQVNPGAATQTAPGLMAAADKVRLNAITDAAYKNPEWATKAQAEAGIATSVIMNPARVLDEIKKFPIVPITAPAITVTPPEGYVYIWVVPS
jgi:hypothetical protein